MRSFFPVLAVLLWSSTAMAQSSFEPMGPPPPLAGVALDLQCDARLPAGHPVVLRHPGVDLYKLAGSDDEADLLGWLDEMLCNRLWRMLEAAGAHPSPADVRLPARAIVEARLVDLQVSETREVDQRIGGSILQVAVPHWSLGMRWSLSFAVHYPAADPSDDGTVLSAPPLDLSPRAGAEQDDYAPLKLGALLEVTAARAFAPVPQIIADDGRLGDLLFARVDRPPGAPVELGATEPIGAQFWQLLVSEPKHRHDALAFHLGSEEIPRTARIDLAHWFLLNDSNPTLRKDVLSWLLRAEHPPDAEQPLSSRLFTSLRWMLGRDGSPRMRGQVIDSLEGRTTQDVRDLLLLGSTDRAPLVSERSLGALRRFSAPTVSDYQRIEIRPASPRLASWTIALDGRVVVPDGSQASHRLALVRVTGGPPSETWLVRWLRTGPIEPHELEWALEAWAGLLGHESTRVRRATIERLSRETEREEARTLLAAAVSTESLPELRIEALLGIGEVRDIDAKEAVLKATEDPDAAVRIAAAEALMVIAGRSAQIRLEALRDNDPDPKVRRRARKSLRKRAKASDG
jgi:hypothetical protein